MKILIATRHEAMAGGVEVYLRQLVPLLTARGHVVRVVTEEVTPTGSESWALSAGLERGDAIRNAAEFHHKLADVKPDVVFSNQVENLEVEEAIVTSTPSVLFSHTFHGTCVSGRKMHAAPIPRPCGRPLGVACLALYLPKRCGGLNPWTALRLYHLQSQRRDLLSRYGRLVVASHFMLTEVTRAGVDPMRVTVLPYFCPQEARRVDSSAEDRPRGAPLRILYMGRLTDLKGCLLLGEALERARRALNREVTLVVAGDGPLRNELALQCQKASIPHSFLGWVDQIKKSQIYSDADLLVVPSTWPEPFGIVGIEAAAAGVPAVAFDVGGVREWLKSGETGELASANPPSATGLAEAIVRAATDPETLRRLGRSARERSQLFRPSRHILGLEDVLRAAIAEGVRP